MDAAAAALPAAALPFLSGAMRGRTPGMKRVLFGRLDSPAEVCGDSREDNVQPDVMTVDRSQAEYDIEHRDQTHNREDGIDDGHRARIKTSTRQSSIGREAPDPKRNMDQVVNEIDRKQPKQKPMTCLNG